MLSLNMFIKSNYSKANKLLSHFYHRIFVENKKRSYPSAKAILGVQSPVIHAQTVVQGDGLPRVGHHIFFSQEVVAKELLYPACCTLDLSSRTIFSKRY